MSEVEITISDGRETHTFNEGFEPDSITFPPMVAAAWSARLRVLAAMIEEMAR